MDWFRSHHGAPTDPKFLVIAAKANSKPGVVAALWWALMDRASQATPRGSIAGVDAEALAAFFGWSEDEVVRVLDALRAKGMIAPDDTLPTWEKRNPGDYSTERVRRFRNDMKRDETDETLGNGVKRSETQRRGEESSKKRTTPPAADAAVPPTSAATAKNAVALLGNGGAEALGALRPPGGIPAALVAIRTSLLYESEDDASPDESVKGLSRVERRQLVSRALVEMAAGGGGWSSVTLSAFVRRLATPHPTRAGPNGKPDPWALTASDFPPEQP